MPVKFETIGGWLIIFIMRPYKSIYFSVNTEICR